MEVCMSLILICLSFLQTADSERRIIGGKDVQSQEEAPYAVFIASPPTACSGFLIAVSWVLTAAHCVSGPPHNIILVAGCPDVTKDCITKQERICEKAMVHPEYWPNFVGQHDIALLKTVTPFKICPTVQILTLSGDPWPQKNSRLDCLAYGWGVTGHDSYFSKPLAILNTSAVHGENKCPCLLRYQAKRVICLEKIEGKGICNGDSGSALVCNGKGVGVAHAILPCYDDIQFSKTTGIKETDSLEPFSKGIVEVSRTKVECGRETTLSLYMYICPYLDWIKGYVKEVPPKPTSCEGESIKPTARVQKLSLLLLLIHQFILE